MPDEAALESERRDVDDYERRLAKTIVTMLLEAPRRRSARARAR